MFILLKGFVAFPVELRSKRLRTGQGVAPNNAY
jgi:hypothetical protein